MGGMGVEVREGKLFDRAGPAGRPTGDLVNWAFAIPAASLGGWNTDGENIATDKPMAAHQND